MSKEEIEENAEKAIEGITPDWFDYLREERKSFVEGFFERFSEGSQDAANRVWCENIIIAFDQMYETCALTYLHRLKRDFPNAKELAMLKFAVAAVTGEFKASNTNVDEKTASIGSRNASDSVD